MQTDRRLKISTWIVSHLEDDNNKVAAILFYNSHVLHVMSETVIIQRQMRFTILANKNNATKFEDTFEMYNYINFLQLIFWYNK